VRSEPRIGFNQIGTLSTGSSYPVEGKNGNSLWLQINYQGQAGWVCAAEVNLIDEDLMFVVPRTDQTTADCAGGTTATPVDELSLIASCSVNPFLYEFYSDPTNQINLIVARASGELLKALQTGLQVIGLGTDAVSALRDPLADEVILNIWYDPLTSDDFIEVVRKNGNRVISTDLLPVDLTETPVCGISAG
jgi:hypothetical protein